MVHGVPSEFHVVSTRFCSLAFRDVRCGSRSTTYSRAGDARARGLDARESRTREPGGRWPLSRSAVRYTAVPLQRGAAATWRG